MIAKFIAWGADRDTAIDRLRAALAATQIEGVTTNLAFLQTVLDTPEFRSGAIWTGFVEERLKSLVG
jgi:acetyl/propionyl-CoA carboxylase alpha subunit